jgi:hypothetical protein
MPTDENDLIKDNHIPTSKPGSWTEFFLNGPAVSEDFFLEKSKTPVQPED